MNYNETLRGGEGRTLAPIRDFLFIRYMDHEIQHCAFLYEKHENIGAKITGSIRMFGGYERFLTFTIPVTFSKSNAGSLYQLKSHQMMEID